MPQRWDLRRLRDCLAERQSELQGTAHDLLDDHLSAMLSLHPELSDAMDVALGLVINCEYDSLKHVLRVLTELDPFTVETLMIGEHHTLDHLTDDDFQAFVGSIEAVAANEGISAAAWVARERADMVAAGLMADDSAKYVEGDAA